MRQLKSAFLFVLGAGILFAAPPPVTFHKDVEPVLQQHCQSCHRPGEVGPMSLLTYQDTRKWAAAIKEAVALKKMPPWFADPSAHQTYRDDNSLSRAEAQIIKDWVNSGAPEGNAKDAPPPRKFVDGWNIGQPDMIVEMPEAYQIPATGTVEYTYIIMPTNFKQDMWVRAAEIRPGNRSTLHHAILFTRTPGSKWLAQYPTGVPFVPDARPGTKHRSSDGDRTAEGSLADEWIVAYVPGQRPWNLPEDTGFLIKAGSDFVLQLHYTPKGTAVADRTKVGLVFSKTPPARRAYIAGVSNSKIEIPPGDANYKAEASLTFASDTKMLMASPHMHLRGKAMTMSAVYPTGESETLFDVPHYDFNWQQMYEFATPKTMPAGTQLKLTAVYDNSLKNPANPDPSATVHWGDQSYEEMMLGVFAVQIDPQADLDKLFESPKKKKQVADAR